MLKLSCGNDKEDLHSGSPPSSLTTCKRKQVYGRAQSHVYCTRLYSCLCLISSTNPWDDTDERGHWYSRNCSGFGMRHHSLDLLITEFVRGTKQPLSGCAAREQFHPEPRVPKSSHLQLVPVGLVETSNGDRQSEAVLGALGADTGFHCTWLLQARSISSLLSFSQHIFK